MTGSSISPLSNSFTNLAHSISEDEPCPICRENFGRHSVAVSACKPKHQFHLECISKWFSRLPLITQRKCCICQGDALPLTREDGANLQESDVLLQACRDEDISKIQKILNEEPLLAKGPIYDLKRGELTSPLIVAIANKSLVAAMMLVDAGADINSQYEEDGATALGMAIVIGNIPMINKLTEAGADINFQFSTSGIRPLHMAVVQGNIALVNTLIEAGAEINVRNTAMLTPLDLAIAMTNIPLINTLIDAGADINSQYGKTGISILHRATLMKNTDLINKLISAGANVNTKSSDGRSVLHTAVQSRNIKVVRCIVESGADVNSPKNNGITALHYAAADGQTDIVRELLSAGANANARTSKEGMTALHLASCAGHSYTVRELLEKDISNDIIFSSYGAALMNGHAAIVKMLINYREIIPKVFLDNYATRDLFRRRRPSLFPSSPHIFLRSTKVKQFIDTFL